MKISRRDLRSIIAETVLNEQANATVQDPNLLAAVLASEAPNNKDEMRAIYDVLETRVKHKFKDLTSGTIDEQITAEKQFSGYNRFNNKKDFINYYSGKGDYSKDRDHVIRGTTIETIKLIRRQQFKKAHEAIELGPKGFGATHFVNPRAATTSNKWWESENFKMAGEIGNHLFGWDMTVRQAREAYNKRKK